MIRSRQSGARYGQIALAAQQLLAGKRCYYATDSAYKECMFWWEVAIHL